MLPSPSSSPANSPKDLSNSRKRQRSLSMESEPSSSSPKRSVSQDPSQSNDMSALSLSDIETNLNSYMAEQGGTSHAAEAFAPIQKLHAVETLAKQPMRVGETWYVISRRWYKRWHKACSGEEDKEGHVSEHELGPIDNSSLVDQQGRLTSSVIEHVDCEFVPEGAWNLLVGWYGTPIRPLPRKVIARGIVEEPTLELHPPHVKVHNLTKVVIPGVSIPPRDIAISSRDTVADVCRVFAARILGDSIDGQQYRVWRIREGGHELLSYTPNMLKQQRATLINAEDEGKTVEDALIESGDTFVVELQVDGQWQVEEQDIVGGMLGQLQHKTAPTQSSSVTPLKTVSLIKARCPAQDPGTLGLGNMGNTCFMNSALQCLAHTRELTEYFLSGVFEEELNFENPLGMHGAIAQAFGALLSRIWEGNGTSTSYAPREFKAALQRFAPQFSGYQQHDSQELVAFLLDGLHEDLNRVRQKPYVEKPDWNGGGDKELVELARESWQGYMKRNDSVIVDLFQGQYQSTLVCPECSKVQLHSIPSCTSRSLCRFKRNGDTQSYIPWDLDKPHVKIPIELGRDSSFKDVRQLLGRWMCVDPDNLLTIEEFNHRIYKNLDDTVLCEDMQQGDHILCFELPCHAQQTRNAPVYGRGATNFGIPFVVVIDRSQASQPYAIYDAIVERLQRWTANVRPPALESVTEIKENGDVITVEEEMPEEGDIVDEKAVVVREQDEDEAMDAEGEYEPRDAYGVSNQRFDTWEQREKTAKAHNSLDNLYFCELVTPSFASLTTTSKHTTSGKSGAAGSTRDGQVGRVCSSELSDEFTKEESLAKTTSGTVPAARSISKRRSALIFGRFLMCRERLMEEGADLAQFGLDDLDEPLIYDLYAVDEHLGGLGGGHYRAYAQNHMNGKWYHFDDSYVTPSNPEAAVNSNAYLLFYKRRTTHPLGGKSHAKIEEARNNPKLKAEPHRVEVVQVSTSPSEEPRQTALNTWMQNVMPTMHTFNDDWHTPQSLARSSPTSSLPPLDDGDAEGEPPSFEDAQYDNVIQTALDPLVLSARQFDYPNPPSRGSPTSSNEAEPDLDDETRRLDWNTGKFVPVSQFSPHQVRLRNAVFPRDEVSSTEESSLDGSMDVSMLRTDSDETDYDAMDETVSKPANSVARRRGSHEGRRSDFVVDN
ncbi:putative ubiquitin carboxyl-terminal hydrolase 12 [Grifola frondosa]|uniref:ubiquitinyl hydrolase 1 n=1 Tax=Grifola frondosa TaxID=5627 RepID=A0A1C7MAE2_GRIFR|nr:putative ubiquitin carboxyl-terminal hydrolase 12 [Grifola frondosa]